MQDLFRGQAVEVRGNPSVHAFFRLYLFGEELERRFHCSYEPERARVDANRYAEDVERRVMSRMVVKA